MGGIAQLAQAMGHRVTGSDANVYPPMSTQLERIGIELKVTPYVNKDGFITLDINPKVEDIKDYITVDGDPQRPIKSTRQADTTVMIKDGQTVVIGGLMRDAIQNSEDKVPVRGDIPILGYLFKHTTKTLQKTNLLIVLTPYVIRDQV